MFAQFLAWINAQLSAYVGTTTATIAQAVEPAAVTLTTIYVMMWGFLSLTGRIEEPIWEGVKRILTIALVLGIGIRLWVFNSLFVDTFFVAPDRLAASIVGSPSIVSVLDDVWVDGNLAAEQLLGKGSVLNGDFAYYLAGFVVYFVVGLAVVYTAFLMVLSKLAIAVILAFGPVFIALLLFDATKRFFEAWIAQLANYALITILSILVSSLLLQVIRRYVASAVSSGAGITIAESVRVSIFAALIFLLMRQVMPIASGLASGIALNSYGVISGMVSWGLRGTGRSGYQVGRGVLDGLRGDSRSRWDSLRRGAGNVFGSGVAGALGLMRGRQTGGTVVPRERVMPRSTVR